MPHSRRSTVRSTRKSKIKSSLRYKSKSTISHSRKSKPKKKKKVKKVKHILICGHGSLPPESYTGRDKMKVPFLPYTNEGDKPLLKMNIKLDRHLSKKSLLVTGSVPGTLGQVSVDNAISIGLFRKVNEYLRTDSPKDVASICDFLNSHKGWDDPSRGMDDVNWRVKTHMQPTVFHPSSDNITVYFHEMSGGSSFYAGVYDIDDCRMNLNSKTFSHIENSKFNISKKVFDRLRVFNESYSDYKTEVSSDLTDSPRKNYYMKAPIADDATVGVVGPEVIDGDRVRPLTVPLKYLEKAIRKVYKDDNLEIIFYSTICKATEHDLSKQMKVDSLPFKSERDKELGVDVLGSVFETMNLDRGQKKKKKKKRKKKKKSK